MSMPLISVIVPVYKVEAYLDKCISSITQQTYNNLEIILVDDGSPDSCGTMCDAWAQKDSRIKVIHKENGGLSDARNAGMAMASGEYIGFVDSDDYISPDMYQVLYERMMEDDSDIAACGVEMVWEDGTPSRMLTRTGSCVLNTEEAMLAIIRETYLKQPVWHKLYRTDLIRDIRFPVGKYHEDVFWTYQALGRAKKVSVFDHVCYFYTQRSGSIMGESYSPKRLDGLEGQWNRVGYVMAHHPRLETPVKTGMMFSCMYALQKSICHLREEELAVAKETIHTYLQRLRPLRWTRTCRLKQRVWILLMHIHPEGTCRLRNKLRIGL